MYTVCHELDCIEHSITQDEIISYKLYELMHYSSFKVLRTNIRFGTKAFTV